MLRVKIQYIYIYFNSYFNKLEQIELMETHKTTHQGIKLSRVMYGYEPSEEALKSIVNIIFIH